jgi:mono/diheme cytochrome c family protein
MPRKLLAGALALGALLPLPGAATEGAVLDQASETATNEGMPQPPEAYLDACAGCHGATGRGDGPNAAALTVEVPDLSRIAARAGGAFDIVRVVYVIDGRAGLGAHEGPMPMYGGRLTGRSVVIDGPGGAPVATTEPILDIARWLETIQEETQ